jgi:hypothetical protein
MSPIIGDDVLPNNGSDKTPEVSDFITSFSGGKGSLDDPITLFQSALKKPIRHTLNTDTFFITASFSV